MIKVCSSLIQTILSVPESHRISRMLRVADYTAGREFLAADMDTAQSPCPEEFSFHVGHYSIDAHGLQPLNSAAVHDRSDALIMMQ